MKYYIIAGERSGDLHASNLMRALKAKDAEAFFRFWGGDYMQNVGGEMVVHYRQLAFMGFLEVILNLFTISKFISQCKKDISVYQPDILVLVDYGGFNLKIAKYAKSVGLKVVYYISPKVWAWNQKRAYKIKDRVDKMLCILPFEVEFYQNFNWKVEYVGNPVVEAVKAHKKSRSFFVENNFDEKKGIIAILPGSRKQEVTRILPTLIPVINNFPDRHFVVAGVDNLSSTLYDGITNLTNTSLLVGKTYDVLAHAKAAIVCSGTATLETALFNVPQVIVYKAGYISYKIAKAMIKVKYIGLANLIVNEEVVKELIQGDCTTENITKEVQNILENGTDYMQLNEVIGDKVASVEAAKCIVSQGDPTIS